jgi:hypothetical protein
MSGLGEAFAKVTSEKAQGPIGAEFNAALNGGNYELRHSEESGSKPVESLVGAHKSDVSAETQGIGVELNAALNDGDYEVRHSKSGEKFVSDPSLVDKFNKSELADETTKMRFSRSEMAKRVANAPTTYGERPASLQAQTDALCDDVTKDAQSGIEIEDF